jgi:hypothetical protein
MPLIQFSKSQRWQWNVHRSDLFHLPHSVSVQLGAEFRVPRSPPCSFARLHSSTGRGWYGIFFINLVRSLEEGIFYRSGEYELCSVGAFACGNVRFCKLVSFMLWRDLNRGSGWIILRKWVVTEEVRAVIVVSLQLNVFLSRHMCTSALRGCSHDSLGVPAAWLDHSSSVPFPCMYR